MIDARFPTRRALLIAAATLVACTTPPDGGYHVIALDPTGYRWSMVIGPNRDDLWILSRDKVLPDAVRTQLLAQAKQLGVAVDQLSGRANAPRQLMATRLSPKKLRLTKWTAVNATHMEKHFMVTKVVAPELPSLRIEAIELQAVHSGRSTLMPWRALTDESHWRRGWV